MRNKELFRRFYGKLAAVILAGALLLGGCGTAGTAADHSEGIKAVSTESTADGIQSGGEDSSEEVSGTANRSAKVTTLDVNDMFTSRDRKADYDESECTVIELKGNTAVCSSGTSGEDVSIEEGILVIRKAGKYILRGSFQGTVKIEAASEDKVQLILDGAEISCDSTAAVYAKEADKVFLTLAEGSRNVIVNTGEFEAVDENNIDGAIYAKCDLTLNGSGTLSVSSEQGHGIVSKDDLVITGGIYEVTSGDHGISGKDSIRIENGTISVTCVEDGLHSGNDEDADKGFVYIAGGEITIHAGDDGIHGESKAVIAGGVIRIEESCEGVEAAIVEIAGGDIRINASDDGVNATDGSGSEFNMPGGPGGFGQDRKDAADKQDSESTAEVCVLISGGRLEVNASGDGIDANGDLYITGGETYVSGPENAGNGAVDYDRNGEIKGGTFIAVGSVGMAMNFSSATQGSALITTDSVHESGETVELKDQQGNVLIRYTPTSRFNSIVVSCEAMKKGETYTLSVGSETKEIVMEELISGESGFPGFGGPRGGNFDRGNLPEGFDENFKPGDLPEGFDGNFEGRPEPPEGFDGNFEGMPERPEGFDGNSERKPERPESDDKNTGEKSGKKNRQ
ncbi:MAG: carbohydrate-binding domain-containing protein [Lachnospiraceae bacterium]|nr:carbohydrate-binding domain-containing protein [Lachnospiraceae bacterium]